MGDVTCKRCAEPWDTHHVRHEAFDGSRKWDGRDGDMPRAMAMVWDDWQAFERDGDAVNAGHAYDELGRLYYASGLAVGCTSCWADPSRRITDPEALHDLLWTAVLGDTWDGDPGEFLGLL